MTPQHRSALNAPHRSGRLPILAAGLLAAASTAALPSAAQADPSHQDWATVDQQTQQVAGALGRTAAPIDRRIKLARCPERPAITAMNSSNLAVRCPSLGWRLRVAMLDHRGSGGDGDSQSSYFAASAPASQRAAASAPIIRRGDIVRISIETPNYSVSYPATAIQDGRMGEAISLRGADPKNPILAVVAGAGRAVISR